ncbi:MAG: RNA polymerase sigma factor [bacterium]
MAKNNLEKPDRQTEIEWIYAAQRDPAAFEHLFKVYYNDIFNYALRRTGHVEQARDITANTFLQALNHIDKFRWQGIRFSSWLFRIATNELNQDYRKTKRLVRMTPEISRVFRDDTASDAAMLQAEEQLAQNQKFKQMHTALSTLKVKYQTVLTLRYFENKSLKEIAEILELSENTVKTHIRRGLMALREML